VRHQKKPETATTKPKNKQKETNLRMYRIGETPDQYQRGCHDDFGGVVDTVVERHSFTDGYSDDPFSCRMPVDARYSTLLAEL
jgi:hypothetical protein